MHNMTAERRLAIHYALVRRRLMGCAVAPSPRRMEPVERIWPVMFGPPSPPAQHWRRIIWEVEIKYGLPHGLLVGGSKLTYIINARFESMRRIHDEVTVNGHAPSLDWIGSKFGGRDHSCVIGALRPGWRRK